MELNCDTQVKTHFMWTDLLKLTTKFHSSEVQKCSACRVHVPPWLLFLWSSVSHNSIAKCKVCAHLSNSLATSPFKYMPYICLHQGNVLISAIMNMWFRQKVNVIFHQKENLYQNCTKRKADKTLQCVFWLEMWCLAFTSNKKIMLKMQKVDKSIHVILFSQWLWRLTGNMIKVVSSTTATIFHWFCKIKVFRKFLLEISPPCLHKTNVHEPNSISKR